MACLGCLLNADCSAPGFHAAGMDLKVRYQGLTAVQHVPWVLYLAIVPLFLSRVCLCMTDVNTLGYGLPHYLAEWTSQIDRG